MSSGSGMVSSSPPRPKLNCSREVLGPIAARGVLGRSSSTSSPKLIFSGLSGSLISFGFKLNVGPVIGAVEGPFGVAGRLPPPPAVIGDGFVKLVALPFPNRVPRFTSELLNLIFPIPGALGAAKSTMDDAPPWPMYGARQRLPLSRLDAEVSGRGGFKPGREKL